MTQPAADPTARASRWGVWLVLQVEALPDPGAGALGRAVLDLQALPDCRAAA